MNFKKVEKKEKKHLVVVDAMSFVIMQCCQLLLFENVLFVGKYVWINKLAPTYLHSKMIKPLEVFENKIILRNTGRL